MTDFLSTYHAETVVPCRRCEATPGLGSHLTFQKLPPFVGKDFRGILILGHSPKVRTKSAIDITLDLNSTRKIRQYIIGSILDPLGIPLEWCAAVNIVRCLTSSMPEETRINNSTLMDAAFVYCQEHLRREIREVQPKLIISLSETVANALQKLTRPEHKTEPMKQIFATMRLLAFDEVSIPWIPVVHIPKWKVRDFYFPKQTDRLIMLRDEVQQIISGNAGSA